MKDILQADERALFAERFNTSCFLFHHSLHRNSIFDLENLVELSRRLPGSFYSTADDAIVDGWRSGRAQRRTLPETVASMAESNSLVLLKGVAQDPEFGPLFRDVLAEIKDVVGAALCDDVAEARATLVLSSPHRVTPYHVDAEVNFLFQLQGAKMVNIFDPNDRTLLTDRELEDFYGGDINAAKYKQDRQNDARVFHFVPGEGLHLPILAPHWTLNGDSVSVAISVNCSLRSNARVAKIYKLNRQLRNRGLAPLPPGTSAWQDQIKVALVGGVSFVRERAIAVRPKRGEAS